MKNRPLFFIVLFVLCVHVFSIVWLVIEAPVRATVKPTKKLLVQTISLQNKTVETVSRPAPPQKEELVANKVVVKAPALEVKKVEPKVLPKPKEKGKKSTQIAKKEPEKKEDQKRKELLAKAQENIAKINQTRDKRSTSSEKIVSDIKIPEGLSSLKIDEIPSVKGSEETSYQEELALRLRLLLRLPEYGEVKIKLTLAKNGKVAGVEILSAESKTNSQYIEKTLPALQFPPFGNQFGNASQYTFAITLSND